MRILCIALAGMLLLWTAVAGAQPVDYRVVVEAPDSIRALITDNLALIRLHDRKKSKSGNDVAANKDEIDAAQLKRLVEEARAEIETLVSTEGYFTPVIVASLEPEGGAAIARAEVRNDPDNKSADAIKAAAPVLQWVARFTVEPGAQVHVTEVQLSFTGAILTAAKDQAPSTDELRGGWLVNKGDVFRQDIWEAAKRKLLQQLVVLRYPQATLTDSRAEVNVPTGEVILKVDVDSGPSISFGELKVIGLQRYPLALVTDLNPIAPGEVYNQTKLLDYQRRLQDSGFFLRVDVSAEADITSAGGAVAPVLVSVTENNLQRVGLGAGYSTNTGSRGQVSYDRLNLFDTGVRLKSIATIETKKQTALVDFLFPSTASGKRDSISTYYKREDVQNEITRTTGIGATRAWGEPQFERSLTLGYGRERRDVRNTDDLATPDVAVDITTTFSQTVSANYSVTWRRTDNLLSPSKGYLINLQAGAAPTRFLTTTPFARFYGKYAGYFPLGESNTLILRAEGGIIGAKERVGIPADFLFRAGGDQSIRGYGYQELGVKEGLAVVGGRYLGIGSAEVVHWLSGSWSKWGVAAFVDGGNAADSFAGLRPVYGYGGGARWRSPVGVINLDVGYGQAVKQARLHFSLGVSF